MHARNIKCIAAVRFLFVQVVRQIAVCAVVGCLRKVHALQQRVSAHLILAIHQLHFLFRRFADLNFLMVFIEHFNIQRQALQLFDQYLERFRNARFGNVLKINVIL